MYLQIELTGTQFFISWDLFVHVFLNEIAFLLYHYTFDYQIELLRSLYFWKMRVPTFIFDKKNLAVILDG